MGPLVALLLMLSLSVLWLFFKFQPVTPLTKVLRLVNRLFLGLASVMAVLAIARIYTTYTDPLDAKLMTQLALIYALGMICVVVGLGFIIRNFVIFRRPRY